ncbi:MAG: hypothetical protein GY765_00160, partial [bacterium]|nr:hypothetical protein [bacterium]
MMRWTNKIWISKSVGGILLLIPLLVCLLWGPFFSDPVLNTFTDARLLAAGSLPANLNFWNAPLYSLLLVAASVFGAELSSLALILTAFGWGVMAVALYLVGKSVGGMVTAVAASILLLLSPAILPTLGQETIWLVGLAWLATAFTIQERNLAQAISIALLVALRPNPASILLAISLVSLRFMPFPSAYLYEGAGRESMSADSWSGCNKNHTPQMKWGSWMLLLLTAVGVVGWGYFIVRQGGDLFAWWQPDFSSWLSSVWAKTGNQAAWLHIPLAALGLGALWKKRWPEQIPVWMVMIWSVMQPFFSSTGAGLETAVSIIFLAAVGIEKTVQIAQNRQNSMQTHT